jgi:uncharacterized protein YjdB
VSPSSIVAGSTAQATATTRDASGNVLTGREVAWSSSAPGIATVSASGVVTGVAPGTATITATSENRSGSATVTVTQVPVASVSLTPTTATIDAGGTVELTATARSASGQALTGRTVTWATSNPAVAFISSSGVVTGIAPGTATITATVEGRSDAATITVRGPVARVTITPSTSTIGRTGPAGERMVQLTATAFDAAGNVLPGRTFTWISSSNSRASVDANGLVRAGDTDGVATITAITGGRFGTASVRVVRKLGEDDDGL